MGLLICKKYLLAELVEFESYLKVHNKSSIKQILCYAKRYHIILETGDVSSYVNLQSGAVRRHIMEALTALSKYRGCHDRWQEILKHYELRWTSGDESIKSLE